MSLQKLWEKKTSPDQSQIDVIYEQMTSTIEAFKRGGINYHLVAGSALGQARVGGLIPWDDDVDFGIHRNDASAFWDQRDYLASMGYGIVHADIGFKLGSGNIIPDDLIDIDGIKTAVGAGVHPFADGNQDIFLFNENGSENGVDVMRYSSDRALETWPKEVIPVKGWYNPTDGGFGGYPVKILPKVHLEWSMKHSYGPDWKTHDGFGSKIENISCSLHSSMNADNN